MTPEGWTTQPLEALCLEKGHYGANVPKASFDPKLPRYVRITDINDNARLAASDRASIAEADANDHMLRDGDIVIARSGATVGKSYRYTAQDGRCAHAGYLIRFRTRADVLASEFLGHYLRSPRYWAWVRETQRAQAQPNINAAEYGSLLLPIPPLGEQKKIAAILSSVDEAIEATQAVIDQLQVVKKAMMAELLTRGLPGRHTRFKQTEIGEVPEEWGIVRLGNLLEKIDAGWSPQCESRPANNEEWGVLKVSAVTSGAYRDTEQKALPRPLAPRPDLEVRAGDVLLARANGVLALVGRCVLVRATRQKLMLSDKLLRLRPDCTRSEPAFLQLVLSSAPVRSRMLSTTGGSDMRNVSQANLRALLLPVPKLDEQMQTAGVIGDVETRIESEQQYLEAMSALKAALMSVLLTGEVRVNADDSNPNVRARRRI